MSEAKHKQHVPRERWVCDHWSTRRRLDLPSRTDQQKKLIENIIEHNGLTGREADIISMLDDVHMFDGKGDVTLDLKHSSSRTVKTACKQKQLTTCILPTSRLLLCQKELPRMLTGVEGLAPQGIGADISLNSNMPDALMLSLAGNAFSAAPCAAVLISAFTSITLPSVPVELHEVRSGMICSLEFAGSQLADCHAAVHCSLRLCRFQHMCQVSRRWH